MIEITDTVLPTVKLVTPQKFGDDRGFFSEVWNSRDLTNAGIEAAFVQDNHALSGQKGTLRGLHYQLYPKAQGKLVRVTRGAVLDVAVDIRRGSPTFRQHVAVELSADNWRQLWVPAGFAHGYITLTDNVEVLYKVTELYSPDHDRGILWSDPDLSIPWGIRGADVILSDKDRVLPCLKDQVDLFEYGENT